MTVDPLAPTVLPRSAPDPAAAETVLPPPATAPEPAADPGPAWRLLEVLGRGGMGVVYRAHDAALDRPVAVKVLTGDDPDLAQRFVTEAQITGQLQHPGVVPVHHLGALPDGRPFLAMKLIQGRDLAGLLDDRPGPGHDRAHLLQVFEAVAQAVGYAHAQGVIHRDLKPGNVMVGAFGEVQVLDWGLAKRVGTATAPRRRPPAPGGAATDTLDAAALQAPTPSATDLAGTQAGTLVGTPAYMAPEQARGEVDRLDARTDVFALGALLCEILTGAPPYPGPTVAAVLAQAARGDPADAFARLDGCGAGADLVALGKACLAADQDGRPADGKAVADAVAAHREAVQAQLQAAEVARATAQTRLAAERQRRRLLAGLAAVLLLGLTASGVLGWLADAQRRAALTAEAAAEQRRALAEAAAERTYRAFEKLTSQESLAFLRTGAKDLTADQKAFLEQAAAFFREATAQAGTEEKGRARAAGAHLQLGYLLQDLGRPTEAAPAYQAATAGYAELARDFPAVPAYRKDLALSHNNLGVLLKDLGQQAAAEAAHRRAVELQEALAQDFPTVPAYRQDLAGSRTNLGLLLAGVGQRAAAEAEYRRALALYQALARDHPAVPEYRRELAGSHNNLGLLLKDLGRQAAAEAEYRRALALRESLARDYPAVPVYRQELAASQTNLGALLAGLGQRGEAEVACRRAVELREALSRDFPAVPQYRQDLAGSHTNLGRLLAGVGQRAAAEAAHRRALALREALARDYPAVPHYRQDLATTHTHLGNLLAGGGQRAAAEAEYRRALELYEELARDFPAVPAYRQDLAGSRTNLGLLLAGVGQPAAAEAEYRRAVELQEALSRDFPAVPHYRQDLAGSHTNLGVLLRGLGQRAAAEAEYRRALELQEGLARDFPAVPAFRRELAGSYVNFGNLVQRQGRTAEALNWYARAIPLLEANLRQEPLDVTSRLFLRNAHIGRASALGDQGRYAEAVAAWDLVLKVNDQPQVVASFQRSRAAAVVAAGLAQDRAWPLLWGWPRW